MNIFRQLLLDKSVKIERFYHRHDEAHKDPKEEIAPCYTVNFVEQGHYQMHVGKESWVLDEQKVFVTHPAMNFRYSHFEEIPTDVSLSIDFDENFAEDIFSTEDFNVKKLPPVIPRTNRLAFLEWQISRLVENDGNEMAIETIAGELLTAVGNKTGNCQVYRTNQLKWYAERIDETGKIIETHYADQHSLASLSRSVGMSSFHFARIFKELKGLSPHQFLINIRLRNAAKQLLEGVCVTDVCYNCGFTNLSHFIRQFGRSFGAPPLQFQKRKMSKKEYQNKLSSYYFN